VLFWIAYRQWRTDDLRLQHERNIDELRLAHEQRMDEANFKQNVFDRRYAVYEKVLDFISNANSGMPLTNEAKNDFLVVRKKSSFLFDEDIKQYVDELFAKVIELERLTKRGKMTESPEELERLHKLEEPIWNWLDEEAKRIDERFKRYLHL
jgi:hypothetical protein